MFKMFKFLKGASKGGIDAIGGTIIAVAVAVFLLSAILPASITNFFAADTSTWSANTKTLWSVLGVIILVAVVWLIYKHSIKDQS